MEIIPTPTHKGFIIRDASGDILDVYFKNMFSSFATTKLEGTDIELKPKNSLGSTFDIIKNNVDCGDIQVKWKNMFIQYYDETMLKKSGLCIEKDSLDLGLKSMMIKELCF